MSAKLRYQQKLHKRKVVNRQFANNPRQVFRQMRGNSMKADRLPTKNEVEKFWEEIWEKKGQFNQQAEWLKLLEYPYCAKAIPKDNTISNEIVQRAIRELQTK